jgi:hypothetical protein
MDSTKVDNTEAFEVLDRVKRGLCGYISYLAACEMNQAFSEYVLYEPILRILTARGYTVHCEYECPGIKQSKNGDKKRLDFYVLGKSTELALEVKWAKSKKPDVKRDIEKLKAFSVEKPKALALLCVFGRQSHIKDIDLGESGFKERGEPQYADLKKTKYGCRIFLFKN